MFLLPVLLGLSGCSTFYNVTDYEPKNLQLQKHRQ